MLELDLIRLDATDHGIFGRMDTAGFSCVTLERHDICIPTGTYKIELYQSPVHGLVPLLKGVAGRSFIEIHAGNYEKDSKGCILVGKTRTLIGKEDGISTPKETLKQLVELIQAHQEDCSISIA